MARRGAVPYRNQSPTGWWIFCEVQQWVPTKSATTKRFPVWENMRLMRARNREQAYKKAFRLAKAGMPSRTVGGQWRFAGISLLLPVHEELEDGAEILWTDHGTISAKKLKRLIKSKRDLRVFDDRARGRGEIGLFPRRHPAEDGERAGVNAN
jgi:hypothetical protein